MNDVSILTPAEFTAFARIAYERAGIALRPGKESLVAARVSRRVRALNLPDAQAYRKLLESDSTGTEVVAFLDAISTNVTSFFREEEHFERISQHVTQLLQAGKTRLRFWSAACSSGEEPYTLAMVVDRIIGDQPIDWRILATDISTAMLDRASQGVYRERDVAPVAERYRRTSFTRAPSGTVDGEPAWQIVPRLRSRLVLRRVNLSQTPFAMPGPLDVILCRNVMIYFDDTVRQGIVHEAERLLAPGGLFIISHTETLAALKTNLRGEAPSIARKGGA